MTYDDISQYRRQTTEHIRLGMYGGWTQGATWTKRLLILFTVVWLVALIGFYRIPSIQTLVLGLFLTPQMVASGAIWQLITAPMVGFVGCTWYIFIFHMLYLLTFGPKVEREWGSRRFIRFFISIAILSTVISFLLRVISPSLAGIPASTISAAIFAIMIAYAANWPKDMFFVFGLFPSPISYIVIFLCCFEILHLILNGASPAGSDFVASGAGIGIGWIAMKFPSVRRLLLGDKKKPTPAGGKRAMAGAFVETSRKRVKKSTIGQSAKDPTEAKKGKRSGYLEL